MEQGEIKGEVKTLYTRVKLSVEEIAYEMELPVHEVQAIIDEMRI